MQMQIKMQRMQVHAQLQAQAQSQPQQETTAIAPSEPEHKHAHENHEGWREEVTDEEHGTYYYHSGTGDSSWDRPAEMDTYDVHTHETSTPANADAPVGAPEPSPGQQPTGIPPGIVFERSKDGHGQGPSVSVML